MTKSFFSLKKNIQKIRMKMIQKELISLFALLSLMALTMGCRDESGKENGDGTPLSIASVSTEAETAVTASGSFSAVLRSTTATLESGSIGVYRVSTTDYAAQSNVKYTYSSGWSSTSPIYLYSATASVCAYYPYSATIEDDPTTSGTVEANGPTAIPLTSQLYSSASDLSYATSVTTPTNATSSPSVSFAMVHAYTKMTFTINHDASYSGTCAVSGIKIANAGIRSSNTLDISTGTYGATATDGSVTVNPEITSITSGNSATATVLMVPTISGTTSETLSGNMTFLFTVDGNTMAATLPVSTNNLTSLAAGSNYQITANISGSGFSVAMGSTAGSGNSNLDIFIAPANCYIVAPSNSITIPVNIKGNGGDVAGTGLSVTHTAASVGILWQTATGLITVGTFDATSQTVVISANTSGISGNTVIAAYSGASQSGNILWSWHIWVTDYNPNTGTTYNFNTYNSLTFMDRNLGATTATAGDAGCIGLHYQWGRKDPLPVSTFLDPSTEPTLYGVQTSVSIVATTVTRNLENSILNPLTFYLQGNATTFDWYTNSESSSDQNDALWGGANPIVPTAKTIFDPCPAGWRVPPCRNGSGYFPWSVFGDGDVTVEASGGTWGSYGITWTSPNNAGYYPAAGCRHRVAGPLLNVGLIGYYWDASASADHASSLYFNESLVAGQGYAHSRANGFSVRCVKEL
jgi:hypothetical protein